VQEKKAEARHEARAHARHGDHEELAVSDDRERAPAQTPDEAHEQRGRGNQARAHRHFFLFVFFLFFSFFRARLRPHLYKRGPGQGTVFFIFQIFI
jgi:hypothetical protein